MEPPDPVAELVDPPAPPAPIAVAVLVSPPVPLTLVPEALDLVVPQRRRYRSG